MAAANTTVKTAARDAKSTSAARPSSGGISAKSRQPLPAESNALASPCAPASDSPNQSANSGLPVLLHNRKMQTSGTSTSPAPTSSFRKKVGEPQQKRLTADNGPPRERSRTPPEATAATPAKAPRSPPPSAAAGLQSGPAKHSATAAQTQSAGAPLGTRPTSVVPHRRRVTIHESATAPSSTPSGAVPPRRLPPPRSVPLGRHVTRRRDPAESVSVQLDAKGMNALSSAAPPCYAAGNVGLTGCGLLLDRFLVVTGGLREADGAPQTTIACYDTVTSKWIPMRPPKEGTSGIAALPEALYGHCCIAHGHRSVWLVGGMCSGGRLSRSILRLTVDLHFSSSSPSQQTPQPSPSMVGDAPPLLSFAQAPPLSAMLTPQDEGSHHSDEALAFSVSACRQYALHFPLGFASCVKLQGVLNPVALIVGGMSTVRDTECGDVCETSHEQKPGRELGDGAAADSPSAASGSKNADAARRLGLTNRVFALNLVDCSIFRVAQVGSVPSPRMLASAAPIVRRDLLGSYGSILYYGGIAAPSSASDGAPVDMRDVFVASVQHDPKAKTFSLIWTKHVQRSPANPWPLHLAGHALCAVPGFVLLLGGLRLPPSENEAPTASGSALALLYDATTGVSCFEMYLPDLTIDIGELVHHRVVVSHGEVLNEEMARILEGGSQSKSSFDETKQPVAFVIGGKGDHFVSRVRIPRTKIVQPLVAEEEEVNEICLNVRVEVSKEVRSSVGSSSNALPSFTWETSVDRRAICIDKVVKLIAEYVTNHPKIRASLPKSLLQSQSAASHIVLIENNLLLYSVGSEGERVPVSNDFVLQRMVNRSGLNALFLSANIIPPIRQYRKISKLGEGSFGQVYSAMDELTGQFFALKCVRYAPEQRESLLREIRLLRSLDHPNIVKYLGVEVQEQKQIANIFFEYVKMEGCGDLTSLLRKLVNPPMAVIRSHLRQVLAALTYLHSYHIVHQDIKGANVLVGVDVTKLADFGTARQLVPVDVAHCALSEPQSYTEEVPAASQRRDSMKVVEHIARVANRRDNPEGTAVFMAPEVLLGRDDEMTTASDIWSLGCLLIEMATGKLPWMSQLTGDKRDALLKLQQMLSRGEKPMYPTRPDFGVEGVNFLDDCLVYDPKLRKTAAQLLSHPFLTDDFDDDCGERVRHPSPVSGATGASFGFPARQSSDLIEQNGDDTLEGMVESFRETPDCRKSESTAAVLPTPVRRAGGLPTALRKKIT